MTLFNYKTIDKNGNTYSGKVDALTRDDAVNLIKKDSNFVVELKKASKGFLPSFRKENKFGAFEKINFTDHLAASIKAGTPIKDALEAYSDEKSEGSFLIKEIINDIEAGKKLSDSFAKHPDAFPSLYISLIKAGEIAGNLDETLEYLANELRREHEFIQRVRSALFYPVLVLGVSALVISFILIFLVPKITQIAQNLGQDTPTATKALIAVSGFFSNNLMLTGILGFLLPATFIYSLKNKKVRQSLASKALDFPPAGRILKKYNLARMLRIIAGCIKYGIPLTAAFETASEVVGNIKYKESCERINQRIQKGISLSDSIASEEKKLYPSIITRTIRGAEKSGSVDSALNRLSIQYEIEVDRELKKLTELLEPVLVIVLGIIVLLIALSVVAPIYQLTTNINV